MKSNIFIPAKIKVGYQHREDTYTKKLAYVIYYDNKGVLRKEKSWKSWIHDKITPFSKKNSETGHWERVELPAIEPQDFENVPTEGFVLNKKVGGDRYSWNPRQTYTRVYDPRGFEFEITIPNLLYILENTNSIKGKGLEGKFVYGWSGTELVLIPENAPEYAEMQAFTAMQDGKVTKADMVPGLRYLTKQNEEVTYLGYYEEHYASATGRLPKKHWFKTANKLYKAGRFTTIDTKAGLTHLASKISDEPDPNFPEYFEEMERDIRFSAFSHNTLDPISAADKKSINFPYTVYWYVKDADQNVYMVSITKGYSQNVGDPITYYIDGIYECEKLSPFNYIERRKVGFPFHQQHSNPWKALGLDNAASRRTGFTEEELFNKFQFLKKVTHLKNGKTTKE